MSAMRSQVRLAASLWATAKFLPSGSAAAAIGACAIP